MTVILFSLFFFFFFFPPTIEHRIDIEPLSFVALIYQYLLVPEPFPGAALVQAEAFLEMTTA